MTRCPSQDWRQDDPPISYFSEALTAFLEGWSIPQDLADKIVIHADGIEGEAGGFRSTAHSGEGRSYGAGQFVVAGPWEHRDETSGEAHWSAEVQIVGGHTSAAEVFGATAEEAKHRADMITAALSAPQGDGKVERLREALAPFAKVCDAFDYWVPEVMPQMRYPVAGTDLSAAMADCPTAIGCLTEGDFRRARAALQRDTGGE